MGGVRKGKAGAEDGQGRARRRINYVGRSITYTDGRRTEGRNVGRVEGTTKVPGVSHSIPVAKGGRRPVDVICGDGFCAFTCWAGGE